MASRALLAAWSIAIAVLLAATPPSAAQRGPIRGQDHGPANQVATESDPPLPSPDESSAAPPPAPIVSDPSGSADDPPPPAPSARPRGRPAAIPTPAPTAEPPSTAHTSRDETPANDRSASASRAAPERSPDQLGEDSPAPDTRPRNERNNRDSVGSNGTDRSTNDRADDEPSGERVWPLRAGAFDFTQAFGCVPELGGYYRPTPGCPGERPGFHSGIDLGAPTGTRFYAAASGWVREAGLDREVGLANTRIVIQHDGPNADYATEYLHWLTAYVKPGDRVRAGQPIGEVGSVGYSTGPHLHFSVIDFDSGEHLDPSSWLPRDRANGAYLGLAPGSREITFDDAPTRSLPDYADPAPPPLPRRQRLPDPPRQTAPDNRADPDAADAPPDPTNPSETERRQRRADRADDRETRNEQRAKRADRADRADRAAKNDDPAPDDQSSSSADGRTDRENAANDRRERPRDGAADDPPVTDDATAKDDQKPRTNPGASDPAPNGGAREAGGREKRRERSPDRSPAPPSNERDAGSDQAPPAAEERPNRPAKNAPATTDAPPDQPAASDAPADPAPAPPNRRAEDPPADAKAPPVAAEPTKRDRAARDPAADAPPPEPTPDR